MKRRKKFLANVLAIGALIFGSTSPAIAQTCYRMPGDLKLITAETEGPVASQREANQLSLALMKNLNRNTHKACVGRNFCMEATGIKHSQKSEVDGYVAYVFLKVTAAVNCLN